MYLEVKALHIITVVAWFAGLFYIFRLFVYHRKSHANEDVCAVLSIMERKLLRYICLPAMIAVLATGTILVALMPVFMTQKWFWIKIALVALLLAYQGLAELTYQRFSEGRFFLSEKECRFINEFPTLVLMGAVLLVVLKPFL
jgi:putative membrane protein